MAVFMNNGVVLTVDGQDLSDYTQSVTLNWNATELDVTAMAMQEFVESRAWKIIPFPSTS